jgi:hypothetical protein
MNTEKKDYIGILPPNLELEAFSIVVENAKDIVKINTKTKIEHDKVLGVFLLINGGTISNYKSKLSVTINSQAIVSAEPFNAFVIEKTTAISVVESMWNVDRKINSSDVAIRYEDSGEIGTAYTATLYFVCSKRK